MRNKLNRFAPPGMEIKGLRDFTVIVLVGNLLFSLAVFFAKLSRMLAELPEPDALALSQAVPIWDFSEALGKGVMGFLIFAVSMVAFVVLNYLYYFEGSKSIYTMARLKNRWELHIRCWTLPVLGAAALVLCKWVLTVVYFLFFLLVTPRGIDLPGWSQLLRGLLL